MTKFLNKKLLLIMQQQQAQSISGNFNEKKIATY